MGKIKLFFKNLFRFVGALLALVRGIMIIMMLFVGAISAYLIYTTFHETVNQYNETLVWKDTRYETPLAEINPALVSNTTDTDAVMAAAAWESLETYVASLDGEPIEDRETAKAILDEAVRWQEVYNLKSDAITRLSLYLELEEELPKAYETLDTSKLEELSQTLYTLEMEESTPAGQRYIERIKETALDFKNAKTLVTDAVGSIGTIKNGVWTIPYTYTRGELAEVLEKLETAEKFPALKDTINVLSDIADVLNYNKNAKDYFKYQDFSESIQNLTRSDYTPVSSIYTYEQAVSAGCGVDVPQIEGYFVDPKSPVIGVFHDGERLGDDEYIRKGAAITAEIDPLYIPMPEDMETEEMENE